MDYYFLNPLVSLRISFMHGVDIFNIKLELESETREVGQVGRILQ